MSWDKALWAVVIFYAYLFVVGPVAGRVWRLFDRRDR